MLRPLTDDDADLLRRATLVCANWSVGIFTSTPAVTEAQVDSDPSLRHYWAAPRTEGERADLGVVAVAEDGRELGVAWIRHSSGEDQGYGFVGETVPELSIAVLDPQDRDCGLGTELLTTLLARAASAGIAGVSLSVAPDNPARALYERHGFRTVGFAGEAETMVATTG